MWLQTTFGFFSVVQKRGERDLTVRARARADLERLRERYLPGLGEVRAHEGTDYPYRARASHEELAAAMAAMARDVRYDNFKNAVAAEAGRGRAAIYHDAWRVFFRITRQEEGS